MSAVTKKDVTVVITAYNEQDTIANVVKAASRNVGSVVVVDDASKDNTAQVIQDLRLPNVALVKHSKNTGKGGALKTALKRVKSSHILFLDADLQGLKDSHFNQFVKSLDKNEFMVVGLRDKGVIRNILMRMLPKIGGERLVRTDIVKKVYKDPLWTDYNTDLLLSWFVKRNTPLHCIRLHGVDHRTKPRKWGFDGVYHWLWMAATMGYAMVALFFRN